MENENIPRPDDPLMVQGHVAKVPTVAVVVEEDETKKKFLPQGAENDGVYYKKEVHTVEIKQTQKFIGLTQEELQRYADDPFWRRLRLALFVLFWLSWILMFVIAIVLVVTSPKCPPKPVRHWWQRQLCHQIYTRSYKDSNGDGIGDFKGLNEKLTDMSAVQTIWPVPVLASKSFNGYDVLDYNAVDEKLGTLDDFKEVITKAHSKNMFVVMDLPLTTMSIDSAWFKESRSTTNREEGALFHWKTSPPAAIATRYVSDTVRNQYYLTHKENDASTPMAILNWNSAVTKRKINAVIDFWVNIGISGFYLGHVEYLGINPDTGAVDWNDVVQNVRELRTHVKEVANQTGKEIALFTSVNADLTDDPRHQHMKVDLIGDDGLNYVLNKELTTIDDNCDASCIRSKVVDAHEFFLNNNDSWPVWEIGSPYQSRVASRLGKNRAKAELLQMLLFMLEGSVNTYYGDELGLYDADPSTIRVNGSASKFVMRSPMQWDDGKNAGFSDSDTIPIPPNPDYMENNLKKATAESFSSLKLFRKMSEWRMNDEAFLYGKMDIQQPHSSVLAVRRNAYGGSANYFAVMNFANQTFTDFDLTQAFNLTGDNTAQATMGIMTTNLANTKRTRNREQVDIQKIHLEPYSGLVIKYK